MQHKYASKKLDKASVAVIGARGYSGLDLCRLLLNHPKANLVACFANDVEFRLDDYLMEDQAGAVPVLPLSQLQDFKGQCEVVFLATPAEASVELAPRLIELGFTVIDLSGAFRLQGGSAVEQRDNYKRWYNFEHQALGWLEKAQYGLAPFAQTSTLLSAELISNPGCYATSVLMPLIPLLNGKLINPDSIVIDAKSGTSGGGRKPSEQLLFTEVEGECLPYRVGKHQHLPEIVQAAFAYTGARIEPHFTTSLLPVRRGIISAIYARMVNLKNDVAESAILGCFQKDFENYPLVKFGVGEQAKKLLSLKRVVGTPRTHIQFQVMGDQLYLFSAIDNLLKGAASQAIENLNKHLGLEVATGLEGKEGIL